MKPQMINAKMNKLDLRSRLVKAAMFAATIFMVAVMTGSIYFKDRVYITDNGVTRELMTSESDVYAILKLGNYQLSSNEQCILRGSQQQHRLPHHLSRVRRERHR